MMLLACIQFRSEMRAASLDKPVPSRDLGLQNAARAPGYGVFSRS